MYNEQQQIIDEVYNNYHQENKHVMYLTFLLEEEFIRRIKHDKEFSKKWGLKIEERELSEDEIWDYIHKNKIEIKHQHAILYGYEVGSEYRKSFIPTLKENYNIPTKLITITYKDKTIESYE